MGATEVTGPGTLNLWSRSSDIRSHKECGLRPALSLLWPEPLPQAIWFAVGTTIHWGIERACATDENIYHIIDLSIQYFDDIVRNARGGFIETKKRTVHGASKEISDALLQWYRDVHPASDERMEFYNELEWPPLVEVKFHGDGFAGEVDAIFTRKDYGTQVIVDWKTGGSKKADESQLHFYHYGLSHASNISDYDNPAFEAFFHHVNHSHLQEAGDYYGDNVIEGLLYFTYAVKTAGAYAAKPGWYCDYCECYSVCPAYNDTQDAVNELIQGAAYDTQHPDYEENSDGQ
jgi:hypothetical protein